MKKILVVEPSQMISNNFDAALRSLEANFKIVASQEAALKEVLAGGYDNGILIVDTDLPLKDENIFVIVPGLGVFLAADIKNIYPDIKIIFCPRWRFPQELIDSALPELSIGPTLPKTFNLECLRSFLGMKS